MNGKFLSQINPLIGIDLGTSRTQIWCQGKGMVIDQPTAIAIHTQTQKVIAIGQDAAEMMGRVKASIKLLRPISKGRVFDQSAVKAMLQLWLQQILGWRYLFSPTIMVSVPASSTQASRQAIIEVLYQLGAREVYTIAQPLAAAIGAGVPIADASGTLIFHLGAGVAEVAVISLGSIVHHRGSQLAGDFLDQKLSQEIRHRYQLQLSLESVQRLKQNLLFLNLVDQGKKIGGLSKLATTVVGKSIQGASGRSAREAEIKTADLAPIVSQVVNKYTDLIELLLADIYPELIADILDKGMLLSGGLSQLVGLDHWLAQRFKVPTAVVDAPDRVVIDGIKIALENLEDFKQSFDYQEASR